MRVVTIAAALALLPAQAFANLCDKQLTERAKEEVALLSGESFADSSPTTRGYFLGDTDYNAWVLTCNRQRDTLGNNVEKTIKANHVFDNDLALRTIKGHYRYLSYLPGLRYAYQIRREKGTWIVTLPTELVWPKVKMTTKIDIPIALAGELGLTASGKICASGATKFRDDDPLKEVLEGRIEVTGDKDKNTRNGTMYEAACRVARTQDGVDMLREIQKYWKREIPKMWNRPGFHIEVIMIGVDTVTAAQRSAWDKDETIWKVDFNMTTHHRPSYKRWVGKFWTNMYVGVPTAVFAHECGHQMGLDDEYREMKGPELCEQAIPSGDHYIMCDADDWADGREGVKAIYPWIVTRRYAVAEAPQCKANSDCASGQYCAKNGLNRNACEETRGTCSSCSADDQCQSGLTCAGKPAGHCVKAGAGAIGDACCADAACGSGKCASGICQCTSDAQCGAGNFCEEPAFAANSCEAKRADCSSCSNANECRGGSCSTFKCVTASSVSIGGTCCRDAQCKSGSCNSDGKCQCKADSDCSSGQYCDTGTATIGKNTCVSARAICSSCSADKQCGSGAECKGTLGFQKCIKENVLSMGAACCMNAQCKTGQCEGGNCVCSKDSDCPSGKQCKKPIGGVNRCD